MSLPRIYQPVPLHLKQVLSLDENASRHAGHALRMQPGEYLTIFNGQGGEYEAIIKQVKKKILIVELLRFNPDNRQSPLVIYLAQGIARGEKMDLIIQKAVELGATIIAPLITARCNVRLDHERYEKRLARWQAIAISACEQCGRNLLPEILAPQALENWISQVTAQKKWILLPESDARLDKNMQYTSIALLLGPEGGLDQVEIDLATRAGFEPLNLGPRTLRTETATLAALTTVQLLYGDMDK